MYNDRITLTPQDILDKEFKIDARGFRPQEVDKFLDVIINDYNELINNIGIIIHRCCDIKREVVEKDERDNGERMLLNFGHTIGHAIEQYYNYSKYTHGEAVAIGMYNISLISEKYGLTQVGTSVKIRSILEKYDLPYNIDIDIENILDILSIFLISNSYS